MKNAIESIDLFAQPVTLTYRGKREFSTVLGGCLSLVIILAFTTYASVTLHELITQP